MENDTTEVIDTEEAKPLSKRLVYGIVIFFVLWIFAGYLAWRIQEAEKGKEETREQKIEVKIEN